jgi:hypothetical protein
MASNDEIKKLLAAMDAATNAIAARIDALKASIPPSGGLSADEAGAIRDSLGAEVAKLQGLAADPANPVPLQSTTAVVDGQ